MLIHKEIFSSNNYIVLDFETTNVNKGHAKEKSNKLLLTVLQGPQVGAKAVWCNEYKLYNKVKDYILNADFLVAHNAKFELQWLIRAGFDPLTLPPVFCTMVGEYVLLGNRKKPLNLSSVCSRYSLPSKESTVDKLIKGGTCPSDIPKNLLEKYCRLDVSITADLFKKELKELEEKELLQVACTEFMFIPVASELELIGMHLDSDKVSLKYDEVKDKLDEAEINLALMTGGINMNSPKQVGEFLYDTLKFKELRNKRGKEIRTATGKRLTDTPTLLQLKARTKKQREFIDAKLQQSKLQKQLGTYLELYKNAIENNNGLLKGNLNVAVTSTHRLSSSAPNMQNQDNKFKELFSPREVGWKLVEADYGKLEWNVAGFLAQDKQLLDDIINKHDPHTYSASVINHTSMGEVTKEQRRLAKADTFGPLYGKTSGTKEQKIYFQAFKNRYADVTRMQEEWVMKVLSDKMLVAPSGMRFYWPDTHMQSSGYVTNTTVIKNAFVQYIASAEIVKPAVRFLWQLLKENKCSSFIVNTVHDSIILEVHPDEEELVLKLIEKSMLEMVKEQLKVVLYREYNFPLEVEVGIGNFWGKPEKEIVYSL